MTGGGDPTDDGAGTVDLEAAGMEPAGLEPADMEPDELRAALEALLLVIDTPTPASALASAVEEPEERVVSALRAWAVELADRGSGMDVRESADGWRMYSRADYAPYVERLLLDGVRSKLTRAALETLAVIAYRQPVTRSAVSAVRGVNVDGVMRTLLARDLIAEAGTDAGSHATLYTTTELFLERLGLSAVTDLPPLAPLLPEVDVIEDLAGTLDDEPRFARLRKPGTVSADFDPDA